MKWAAASGYREHQDRDCYALQNARKVERVPDGTYTRCSGCHDTVAASLEDLDAGEVGSSMRELGF